MSAPVSFIECVSKMAYTRVLSCVMLALISSIIASIQLNHATIDIQENYKRRRLNLSRLLSTTTSNSSKTTYMQTREQREKILDQTRSYKRLVEQLCRSSGDTRRVERELSNEQRRMTSFYAFTSVFVWTG